jgi:DNA-binding response OmpR family regulator
MRVLLVEDDGMIAQGLQTALRQAGFAIDWMRDGKTAAAALEPTAFDVVLLDLYFCDGTNSSSTALRIRSGGSKPWFKMKSWKFF